jgi:hypothetical protein
MFFEKIENPLISETDEAITELFLKRKKERFRQADVAETTEMNEENFVIIQPF